MAGVLKINTPCKFYHIPMNSVDAPAEADASADADARYRKRLLSLNLSTK